jgi:hypothetical protein
MARQLRRSMAGNTAVAQPARKAPPKLTPRPALRPNITEATNLTMLVVAISVATGFVLGGIDYAFQEFFRLLLG